MRNSHVNEYEIRIRVIKKKFKYEHDKREPDKKAHDKKNKRQGGAQQAGARQE